MPERSLIEALDRAVESIMTDPEAPFPRVTPRLAALLRLAGELRDLPSAKFKARLKATLLSGGRTVADAGKPLRTAADIRARLNELAQGPRLVAHDPRAALDDLPEMTMRFLASLNECTIGVSRFSGRSHWERHPAGDELLHVLDGEADVVTLTDEGPVRSLVRAGSLFICARGLWHEILPRSPLSLLFATPGEGTQHSSAKQPRRARGGHARRPTLQAHDLAAAAHGLRELAITRDTTAEEADAAVRPLTDLGRCTLGVMRHSGLTPWERHSDGDELLHVLDGAVDVTVLAEDGPTRVTVGAGSFFVCPRGLWHRQHARPAATMLFGTPTATTEVSWADDPRQGGRA
jgi:quercetin dioxygenase-like cupin family protein